MAPIPKILLDNIWAWRFGYQFDELRRAYAAAREGSDQDRARIEKEWHELEADVAAGRASLTDEDDDGHVVYDRAEDVGNQLTDIASVLAIVREAFAISLHHLWERQLKARMREGYTEPKAFAFLKNEGIAVDETMLTVLRLTANVAKHSAGNSADALYKLRPDLFHPSVRADSKRAPSTRICRSRTRFSRISSMRCTDRRRLTGKSSRRASRDGAAQQRTPFDVFAMMYGAINFAITAKSLEGLDQSGSGPARSAERAQH